MPSSTKKHRQTDFKTILYDISRVYVLGCVCVCRLLTYAAAPLHTPSLLQPPPTQQGGRQGAAGRQEGLVSPPQGGAEGPGGGCEPPVSRQGARGESGGGRGAEPACRQSGSLITQTSGVGTGGARGATPPLPTHHPSDSSRFFKNLTKN